jgi:hypothetical protein
MISGVVSSTRHNSRSQPSACAAQACQPRTDRPANVILALMQPSGPRFNAASKAIRITRTQTYQWHWQGVQMAKLSRQADGREGLPPLRGWFAGLRSKPFALPFGTSPKRLYTASYRLEK